jgi:hypothetical protein
MADFNSIAQQFVQFYYTTFDTNRAGLFPLYTPESMLTFEGEQFMGAQSIVNKILELSCTTVSHQILTIDAQPSSTPAGIIVFVSGLLQLDSDPPLKFSQCFHLNQSSSGQYFVYNDIFRLNFG